MKYIALILTILTITLSAIPCDDDVRNDIAIVSIVTVDHSSNSHELLDLCSPFCTCACCASVVIEPIFDHTLTVTQEITTEVKTSYFFSYSNDYLNRIFQPPRA